ncbi:MAG: DUF962 domain-containing protein [Burkholderiaceae bacterium]
MKTLEQQMAFYRRYHRDPRNRLTHFFGVPAIAFSLLVPLSLIGVDVGGWWLSAAQLLALAVLAYYFALDVALALATTVVFAALLALAAWVAAQGAAVAWTVFAVAFIGGWILQLIGHAIEGRRPALVDNFFQVFIAPIFLMAELFFALGLKQDVRRSVDRLAGESV